MNLKPVSDVGEESLADLLGVAHRHADRLAGHHRLHPGQDCDQQDEEEIKINYEDDTDYRSPRS